MTGTAIVLGPATALSEALAEAVDSVAVIDTAGDAEDTMWQTLVALQAAHSSMAEHGGRIVLVVPTIGMAGAAGSVDYTTAVEGIRAMAKSAARQWAAARIGVNIVAAPVSAFTSDVDALHLSPPAVADGETLIYSIVETVCFLLRPDLHHLIGETVVVDGGSVMLP